MKKKLYYVVDKELFDVDGIEEASGNKTIALYVIEGDGLKNLGNIDCSNSDKSLDVIKEWLDESGTGEEFEFIQL